MAAEAAKNSKNPQPKQKQTSKKVDGQNEEERKILNHYFKQTYYIE